MKTLVLQHEIDTPAGSTVDWLKSRGMDYEILFADRLLAGLTQSFDQLIICGGSMNVDEEAKHPWLVAEKAFIRLAIDQQKKVLGLCLGGQLIAEVLGATVGPIEPTKDVWEIGWHPVRWLQTDEILPALHWHQYQFQLPPGAKRLAHSELCANQAFAFGQTVVGFQFHPEADRQWIEMALEDYAPPSRGAVQTAQEMRRLNNINLDKARSWYYSFLDRFFAR